MRIRPVLHLLTAGLILTAPSCLFGLTVTGIVTDDQGAPVGGAHVLFTREAHPRPTFDAYTAADGSYAIAIDDLIVTAVEPTETVTTPSDFHLSPSYPNPFNPSTTIPYQIGAATQVRLEVYDILGQRIRTLVDASQAPGQYAAVWDGRDAAGRGVAAGSYLCRLETDHYVASRKMLLLDGAKYSGSPAGRGLPSQSRSAPRMVLAADVDPQSYRILMVGDGVDPSNGTA
jgi:hypothetical protein